MTNDEAIKLLDDITAYCDFADEYGDMIDSTPYYEALDLAIKALEQESKTIQEKQAESEKYEKAFDDGYKNGYAQARFDYEQQPSDDCISREAVLDTEYQIKEINGIEYVMLSEVQMKIRKMPSVTPKYTDEEIDKAQAVEQAYVDKMVELAVKELKTPKAKWTPVSERLPEEAGVYLVSMFRLGYPQREVDGFVCGRWERFGNDVIAWCEIPEPYKESEG